MLDRHRLTEREREIDKQMDKLRDRWTNYFQIKSNHLFSQANTKALTK